MNDKRLDQDINFEVGGVPCIMYLDTTVPEWYEGDFWIVKPRDPSYLLSQEEGGSPHEFGQHFASRIGDALEKLEGLDKDGVPLRETRQQYEWFVYNEYALLQVKHTDGLNMASDIMLSLPDWDGDSFDFSGSQRLARILADWKDGVPEIKFTRSDGTEIDYQKYVEHGGSPLTRHLAFDDVMDI